MVGLIYMLFSHDIMVDTLYFSAYRYERHYIFCIYTALFHSQPMFSESLGEPFIIVHSLAHVRSHVHTIEVLLLRVQKDPSDTKGSGFSISLEWISMDNSAGQGESECLPAVQWFQLLL